jgi:hypothetical protein
LKFSQLQNHQKDRNRTSKFGDFSLCMYVCLYFPNSTFRASLDNIIIIIHFHMHAFIQHNNFIQRVDMYRRSLQDLYRNIFTSIMQYQFDQIASWLLCTMLLHILAFCDICYPTHLHSHPWPRQ